MANTEMTIKIDITDLSKDILAKILDLNPIVKCKDCKFCCHYPDEHLECRLLADMKPIPTTYVHMSGDDFCSYGEPR